MSLLERIFFFDREVRRHAYPNARTIASAFEVSLATGKRDIAYLRDRLLAPLVYELKRNGYSYGEADFHLPFSESPRLVLLLAMLNKLAREAGLGNLPEVRRLEHRLSSMISPQYRAIPDSLQCHWIEVEEIEPSIFESVLEALTQQRMLTVVYRPIGGAVTTRQVAPLQLVNHQGRWYLFGYCSLRQANRLFHLARVERAEVTATALPKHLSFDSEELQASFGIFQGPPRYRAAILFTSTAGDLVARQHWHRDQVMSRVEDGIILELPVGDDRELVMKILQYGSMARVLSPPQLAQRVREALGNALALYDVPQPPSLSA
jgi:predicted DNA-binding transcriptional regulator YafY